jgi:hypothetical protein
MTRRAGWALALGVSGLATYAIWLAWHRVRPTGNDDASVTAASEDSFPASDAPSHTPVMGSRVALDH